MAVTNIGLSAQGSSSSDAVTGYRVYAGGQSAPIYLKWKTVSGAEINKAFDIAVNYRLIPRGSSEGSGYTPWKTDWTTWKSVPLSSCDGRQLDGEGGWQWSIGLAELLALCSNDEHPGLDKSFTPDGSFSFGSRMFDQVQIDVHIKSQYVDGFADSSGRGHSPRTDASLWIGYFPSYEVERIYIDNVSTLKIDYSADGWERTDDRWELQSLTAGGEEMLASKPWGTVVRHSASGNGTVVVPMEKLSRIPAGETVKASIRFNASYRASGADFASAEGEAECKVGGGCDDPALTVERQGGSAVVSVAANGDIERVLVKMEGSEFAFDQAVTTPGSTVRFDFLPRNVEAVFTAMAMKGDGISGVVRASAGTAPAEGVVVLSPLSDPSVRAAAVYKVSLEEGYAPEVETVKLAGRTRECAYYGEGGSAEWSLSFDIVGPESAERPWRRASESGDCAMLLSDGRRRVVAFDDFRITRGHPGFASARAYLTEVDA